MGTGHYLQNTVIDAVPFNTMLNIQLSDFDAESVTLSLPRQEMINNHTGRPHASAQYAVAEAASGALLERCFADIFSHGFIPQAVEATIQYRKEACGDLRAVARISSEDQHFIRATLETRKRANFAVNVEILDDSGFPTSIMQVKWMVLPEQA